MTKVPRPSQKLVDKAKKYKLRITKKVGKKRVYKTNTELKEQIKRKENKKSSFESELKKLFKNGNCKVKSVSGYGYAPGISLMPGIYGKGF